MTSKGPFQPKAFYDSVILRFCALQLCELTGVSLFLPVTVSVQVNYTPGNKFDSFYP